MSYSVLIPIKNAKLNDYINNYHARHKLVLKALHRNQRLRLYVGLQTNVRRYCSSYGDKSHLYPRRPRGSSDLNLALEPLVDLHDTGKLVELLKLSMELSSEDHLYVSNLHIEKLKDIDRLTDLILKILVKENQELHRYAEGIRTYGKTRVLASRELYKFHRKKEVMDELPEPKKIEIKVERVIPEKPQPLGLWILPVCLVIFAFLFLLIK